jgi:hypothetical protein
LKFAPIVPVEFDPASDSDFHLILAHEIVAEPEKRDYYKAAVTLGHEIILDNSVIELGHAVDPEMLEEAWSHFPSAWLVAPDAIADMEETIKLTDAFSIWMNQKYPDRNHKLMIVPQGETIDEWLTCLGHQLDAFEGYSLRVGIGRFAEDKIEGGREALYNAALGSFNGTFHLLGIQHNVAEVDWAIGNGRVVGCDSSLPVRAAMEDIDSLEVTNLRELVDVTVYDYRIHEQTKSEIRKIIAYMG